MLCGSRAGGFGHQAEMIDHLHEAEAHFQLRTDHVKQRHAKMCTFKIII